MGDGILLWDFYDLGGACEEEGETADYEGEHDAHSFVKAYHKFRYEIKAKYIYKEWNSKYKSNQ